MCNAWNHPPGCDCGWGGEGNFGGGGYSNSRTIINYSAYASKSASYRSNSFTELAEKFGYSVLFPVDCKYCGMPIYIFATPEGGFVLFDEIGRPWSKHHCGTYNSDNNAINVYPSSNDLISGYSLPVNKHITASNCRAGEFIKGIVVDVTKDGDGYLVDIVDKRYLYRGIYLENAPRIGVFLSGKLGYADDKLSLIDVSVVDSNDLNEKVPTNPENLDLT